jgi:predicted dehydrogenase
MCSPCYRRASITAGASHREQIRGRKSLLKPSRVLELAAGAEIDAVAVSASYALQGEIAVDLLKAGKHVFMEKPMAVSVSQGEKILNAAEQGNARLMIAFMKQFDPGNVEMC